jgi:hypothetical protein
MSGHETRREREPQVHAVMAEFETPGQIYHAAESLRDEGWTRMEAFTPFPIHGLDHVLGEPGTKVPWVVLGAGVTGAACGLLLQWWTSAVDYPIKIAGKPYFSIPAFIPVTFELTVLFSAIAALLGMLALNRLPQFYHPVFKHSTFARATDDRFFLAIHARDPRFDIEKAQQALSAHGGAHIEVLED